QQELMQQQQLQKQQAELEKLKENLKEDASVDYPIVDKMEMELFKTQYKKENIYKRLDRLEEKVFLKKSNEPLNVRVDNLASVVLPRKSQRTADRDLTPEEMQQYYSNPVTQNPITNENIPFQLAVLEQGMFKTVYDKDNIANRLSRIEEKMFNRTFSAEPDVTRAQRLMVAYEAKQSSYKYENNKKMQNMASMSQLGGLLLMILAILL
ncbi:hypothetical protein II906_00725, partial [bacterium]|nr:hypothetical protein [bacterium]